MFAPLIGLALAAVSPGPTVAPSPGPIELARIASWIRSTERQRVSLWTNRDEDPYSRGEQARVYFKAETDGYITVLRVDTDGRIRVLFPREPWEDNFARGGRTFEVLDRDDRAFTIDDQPGVGYVFAVSSPDPFQYDEFIRSDHWDYRLIAEGRIRGDPYVGLTEFASRIAGPGEYDYDIVPYYVEQHYDYPRFVCYDCHSYVSYSAWNPYHYSCNRFRIVVYDDYYYYPYRYYRGGNVVIIRPRRPGARYVFKDYDGRGQYVTRERNRPVNDGRRVVERDRTSADVGGRGSIPAPVEPRRRPVTDRLDGRDTPDNPDTPRRRSDDRPSVESRPADPGTSEPRRKPATDGQARPNVLPRDNSKPERPTSEPRREPDRKENLREVEPSQPNVLAPERRGEPRPEPRSEPRSEPSTEERRAEPRRSEPSRPEPRSEPPRAEPSREPPRSEPPRAEPQREPPRSEPRRAEPPPQSRPQPTGDPQLRRRKPD